MLEGSCLCGGVRYEISGSLGPAVHCHCTQCRKASGASCTTNASVSTTEFRWVEGESLVGRFESSPGVSRCFCTRCGSPLIKLKTDAPDEVRLRLGTLDGDPEIAPVAHIFVGDKAPWTRIPGDLPQFEEEEPRGHPSAGRQADREPRPTSLTAERSQSCRCILGSFPDTGEMT